METGNGSAKTAGMECPAKDVVPIDAKHIRGLKHFDRLRPLLRRLRPVGCKRDRAGNRTLHFDEYCSLIILGFFNPLCRSLRALQQASLLPKVQKQLGVPRTSLGALSESSHLFDPELLVPIISELGKDLQPLGQDARLKGLATLMLVDGTLLKVLPAMMQASCLKQATGSGLVPWRLHTEFEVERYVPTRITLTRDAGDETDERVVLERQVQPDRLYVLDRGYAKFTLFNAIVAAKSSYVCRLRDNSRWELQEAKPLSDAARQADVLSDQIVRLGASSKAEARPDHEVRVVTIKIQPHQKRGRAKGGSTGPGSDGVLRLATNLRDVPAEIIALIYRYRWTIEIFFRFLKHELGGLHLLSHDVRGITIQVYCAIIACMLLSLWTGRKPTRRTREMIAYVLMGWASAEELLAHLAKLHEQDARKAAQKAAR